MYPSRAFANLFLVVFAAGGMAAPETLLASLLLAVSPSSLPLRGARLPQVGAAESVVTNPESF
jgi:hypothetical protein